ncbi:MAG: hypothetical protein U9Q99_02715 [Nanoarchaeota archaeon]|nr:hypothetical protein [Nanoarchaeota archaeon]
MKESDNIKKILTQTLEAIKSNNTQTLKSLSNQTIHSASITQDKDNIIVAVIIYALGKIFERKDYQLLKGWKNFLTLTKTSLERSIKDIELNKEEAFRKDIQIISKAINKVSPKLKKYVQEVFEKAKINKASRLYEHGLSLGKTANLLGTSLYELAGYTGQTGISDVALNQTIGTKQRIKFIEGFFK